ncbi:hypothetical protein [Nocardia sp. NPDC052566]|uniref:hypothetical protein n=1 Tax=Nocardia sp. NPDC052566 TaxID=3364330 RepID=UPI0037C875FF
MNLVPEDLGSLPGTAYGSPDDCGSTKPDVRLIRHENGIGCENAEFGYTRPLWVAWTAPLTNGSETLLARQSKSTRRRSKAIIRQATELEERIEPEVRRETLKEWKKIYDRHIASMPTGLNVVDKYASLDNLTNLSFAGYFDSGEMHAGVLFDTGSDPSTARVRLSAATPNARDAGLLRGLYHRVADYGASLGCDSMSMGFDPNLFGHVVQPGLCVFKLRIGFDPAPAQRYADNPGYIDVTECVVGPSGIDASLLLFEYAHDHALSMLGIRLGSPAEPPIGTEHIRRWIEAP